MIRQYALCSPRTTPLYEGRLLRLLCIAVGIDHIHADEEAGRREL
jgi:hypothetical protein